MSVSTLLAPGFTRFEISNSVEGMKKIWHLIDPSICDADGNISPGVSIPQSVWLDTSREEVNPCNGRWAVQMTEELPDSDIYELRGIFFALNEERAIIYKSPLYR